MSSTVAETDAARIAVERTWQRADSWTEGRPIELRRELRSLCWGIAWQALTGGDLDERPDVLAALELDMRRRFAPSLTRRRRAVARGVGAALLAQLRDEPLHVPLARSLDLLGHHPEYESRWHAELDEVLAGRAVTARDLTELPYTRSVLERSGRFVPAAVVADASPILVTLGQRWAFRTVPGHELHLRPVRRS